WEAAVKSFKHHFSRVIGETLLTYEALHSYATEIEAILNSRPLTSLSSDPNDFNPLTPAHFLIGGPLTSIPEHDFRDTDVSRLSTWQHVQRVHVQSRTSQEISPSRRYSDTRVGKRAHLATFIVGECDFR
ncbi:hypothetical protein WH47_05043, partial [Habropoda laboriosa]